MVWPRFAPDVQIGLSRRRGNTRMPVPLASAGIRSTCQTVRWVQALPSRKRRHRSGPFGGDFLDVWCLPFPGERTACGRAMPSRCRKSLKVVS